MMIYIEIEEELVSEHVQKLCLANITHKLCLANIMSTAVLSRSFSLRFDFTRPTLLKSLLLPLGALAILLCRRSHAEVTYLRSKIATVHGSSWLSQSITFCLNFKISTVLVWRCLWRIQTDSSGRLHTQHCISAGAHTIIICSKVKECLVRESQVFGHDLLTIIDKISIRSPTNDSIIDKESH